MTRLLAILCVLLGACSFLVVRPTPSRGEACSSYAFPVVDLLAGIAVAGLGTVDTVVRNGVRECGNTLDGKDECRSVAPPLVAGAVLLASSIYGFWAEAHCMGERNAARTVSIDSTAQGADD